MKKILLIMLLFFACSKDESENLGTMAQIDIDYGSSLNDPSADNVRNSFIAAQSNFDELYAIKRQVIEIGSWNMYTTAEKSVAWSTKPTGAIPVGINVLISNDGGSAYYPIYKNAISNIGTPSSIAQASVYLVNDSFSMKRLDGGTFQDQDFEGTDNRGYILIDYIIE